jgi:hypothetical protein
MKSKFAFLFSLLILVAPPAHAGKPFPQLSAEYSADMEVSSDGKPQIAGKVFQSGKKQRMEMAGMVSIMRLDKKIMWQVMPQQKSYMEMAIPERNVPPTEKNDAEMTEMGNETVNGVAAAKYKVVSKEGGKKTEGFVWITKEGIMVKTEGKDEGKTVGSELKNLKIGKQDASLFEIPSGYKGMGNPAIAMDATVQKQMKEAGVETITDAKFEKIVEPAEYSAVGGDGNLRIYSTAQKVGLRSEATRFDVSAILQRDKGILTEFVPNLCAYTERKAADNKRWRGRYEDLSRHAIMFRKTTKLTRDGVSVTSGMAEVTDAAGIKYEGTMSVSSDGIIMGFGVMPSGEKSEGLLHRTYEEAKAGKPEASRMELPKGFKKLSPEDFDKMLASLAENVYGVDSDVGSYCDGGSGPKITKSGGGKKAQTGGDDEEPAEEEGSMSKLKKLGGAFGF